MEIRNLTSPYSKNKARKAREFENTLEKRLETLDNKISANDNTENMESELKEYEYLKNELKRLYEKKAEGAIFRSKVLWIEEGEKPTKYFFNMEKKNFNKKVITELKISEGHVTANESQIMNANLYTSSHKATNKTFLEFAKNIDLQIPKLSEEENDECEDKLTLEECRVAYH